MALQGCKDHCDHSPQSLEVSRNCSPTTTIWCNVFNCALLFNPFILVHLHHTGSRRLLLVRKDYQFLEMLQAALKTEEVFQTTGEMKQCLFKKIKLSGSCLSSFPAQKHRFLQSLRKYVCLIS